MISKIFKKKFLYKNAYYIFAGLGFCIPPLVLYSIDRRVQKLERGVIKDLERIKAKGKNFSDIPKTF